MKIITLTLDGMVNLDLGNFMFENVENNLWEIHVNDLALARFLNKNKDLRISGTQLKNDHTVFGSIVDKL